MLLPRHIGHLGLLTLFLTAVPYAGCQPAASSASPVETATAPVTADLFVTSATQEPIQYSDAISEIYGSTEHGKGWLGCAVQGDRVWLSHGSTNTLVGTALVSVDDSGSLAAVDKSGEISPLESMEAVQQWRAAAEGLILAATPRQLWALNFDNNSGGTRGELFRWSPGDGPPIPVSGAQANHNRAMVAVPDASGNAALVAAHVPSVGWPSIQVVSEPAAERPIARPVPSHLSVGVPAAPVVYRGRVFVFTPTIPRNGVVTPQPALGVLASDGSSSEVLGETEADVWPAGATTERTVGRLNHTYWPQARLGAETSDGLFVVAPASELWFFADDGSGGLTMPAVRVEQRQGRAYTSFRGHLLAIDDDGSLSVREDGSWRSLTTLRQAPGAASFVCATESGSIVALGSGGVVDGARAPAWLSVWPSVETLAGL